MLFNQCLYTNVKLGTCSCTIASDGCYLCSLTDGISDKGFNYNPTTNNTLMKNKGAYVSGCSISSPNLPTKIPEIYLEGRYEAWNDAKVIEYLKDPSIILVGEVSGKGIGGSGQHFVRIMKVDVSVKGTVTMTYINDPWGGKYMKVTDRYNAYGNIISLRVFKVKTTSSDNGDTNMSNMYKGYDLSNADSMKVAVDVLTQVINGDYVKKSDVTSQYVAKSEYEAKTNELSEVRKSLDEAVKNYNTAQSNYRQAQNTVDELNKSVAAKDAKLAEYNSQITTLKAEKKTAEQYSAQLQSELTTVKKELDKTTQALAEANKKLENGGQGTVVVNESKFSEVISAIAEFLKELFIKA